MRTQTLLKWFAKPPSAAPRPSPETASMLRTAMRIGIPRVLNLWSTHQLWIGFFGALGGLFKSPLSARVFQMPSRSRCSAEGERRGAALVRRLAEISLLGTMPKTRMAECGTERCCLHRAGQIPA